jgi:hypothetical protein
MWIATEKGFFSIVENKETGRILVRARKKDDLKNLFPEKQIITNRKRDYAYRVTVKRIELCEKLFDLGSELNYSNFKAHIATLEDQKDKTEYYGRIWSIMNDYQSKFIRGLYNYGSYLYHYAKN